MGKDYKKLISKLLTLYTQDELEALLGVGSKSISNYKKGEAPTKKVKQVLDTIDRKLSDNAGKPVPFSELAANPRKVSSSDALLKVLLHEFINYKADKEGMDPEKIRKDILNKARLVLDTSFDS